MIIPTLQNSVIHEEPIETQQQNSNEQECANDMRHRQLSQTENNPAFLLGYQVYLHQREDIENQEMDERIRLARQREAELIEMVRREIVRRHVEPVNHAINDPRFLVVEELGEQFRVANIPRRNLLYRLIRRG